MSFRDRLTWTYAALFAASFLLLGAGAWFSLDRVLRNQVDESLHALASYHHSTWPQSFPAAPDGGKLGPCFFYLDPGGKVLFRSVNDPPPVPPGDPAFQEALALDERLTTAQTPMGPLRVLITRVRGENGASHMLEVGTSLAPVEQALRTFLGVIAGLGALGLLVSVLVGRWLAARALAPVEGVTAAARAIRAQDLTTRLPVPARADEIGALVAAFDQMLARLDASFAAQKQFTADASHELRTPLTALRSGLELSRRRPREAGEYQAVIDSALEDVARLERVLADLLSLARLDEGPGPAAAPVDLGQLAEAVAGRRREEAAARGLALAVDAQPGAVVRGSAGDLARALDNLLANALAYTPTGRVELRVRTSSGQARVEVADTGPGIPAEQQPRIFDRFHRLDPARARTEGGGVGLGLAIARGIARGHGGDLTVASDPGAGATFTLALPRA